MSVIVLFLMILTIDSGFRLMVFTGLLMSLILDLNFKYRTYKQVKVKNYGR